MKWYVNQIPHPALKTKREITKYTNWHQFTKSMRGIPNEQLFQRHGTHIIGEPKYNYGQEEQARNHNISTVLEGQYLNTGRGGGLKLNATFKIKHLKWTGMQEKESNMSVRCGWKIPSLVVPNSDPRDGIFYMHISPM